MRQLASARSLSMQSVILYAEWMKTQAQITFYDILSKYRQEVQLGKSLSMAFSNPLNASILFPTNLGDSKIDVFHPSYLQSPPTGNRLLMMPIRQPRSTFGRKTSGTALSNWKLAIPISRVAALLEAVVFFHRDRACDWIRVRPGWLRREN